MSVLVYRDSDTLSQAVATLLTGCIIEKPASALGLDCSQRLAAVYRKIAGMTSDGLLDWATIRAAIERIQSFAEPALADPEYNHDWAMVVDYFQKQL